MVEENVAEDTIYSKIGPEKLLTLCEKNWETVQSSNTLAKYFERCGGDLASIQKKKAQHFLMMLGCPGQLSVDLFKSHQKLQITEDDFNEFYSAFVKDLKSVRVPMAMMRQITKMVNDLREQIVY